MELTRGEIYCRLKLKKLIWSKQKLLDRIDTTKNLTLTFLKPLIDGNIDGFDRNDSIGLINPLIWEFGHIVFFWEYKTFS